MNASETDSSSPETAVPRLLGYRMPAEWEPHAATWLSWPHNRDSWPGKFEPVPFIFAEIVRHLSQSEYVEINVNDRPAVDEVREFLSGQNIYLDRVRFHLIPTNDAWARDHGPLFITRQRHGAGEQAIVDWGYNAWGGKYPPFDLDDRVPMMAAAELDCPRFEPKMVLEGGSIEVNGRGTLLTTESCLLNPNRNPGMSRDQIEQKLKDFLGVTKVLWLGAGIEGDDTDGHIDDLARFVDASTVVTVLEQDPSDENYIPLKENHERLRTLTDQDDKPLNVLTLPMPPRLEYAGQRLPASYANFYMANELVLVPTFDCEADRAALNTLQRLFRSRRVVGINCTDLVWGLGAIHCVTQQQPAI